MNDYELSGFIDPDTNRIVTLSKYLQSLPTVSVSDHQRFVEVTANYLKGRSGYFGRLVEGLRKPLYDNGLAHLADYVVT